MTAPKLFLHGVPDTPALWNPLRQALGAEGEGVHTPAMPGFGAPVPERFPATMDAYAEWLVGEIEALHARAGPVDLLGHDWGAVLVLRAASLRPELVRSWAVSNAVIDEQYRGHLLAMVWATPILGELFMLFARRAQIESALRTSGVPPGLAATEAAAFDGTMAKCILKLYRSAAGLRFRGKWVEDLQKLPPKGFVLWGEQDPYVPLDVARRFSRARNVPLKIEQGAGHWAVAERAESFAAALVEFWQS